VTEAAPFPHAEAALKRSSTIRLTLAASAAVLVASCSPDPEPEQQVRCYQDPDDPSVCVPERHAGYMPLFYPMFFRGVYYSQYGRVAPPPPINSPAYRAAAARSVGTTFGANGAVARGGFGSTGTGRAVAG
jgi:hypothetical protein